MLFAQIVQTRGYRSRSLSRHHREYFFFFFFFFRKRKRDLEDRSPWKRNSAAIHEFSGDELQTIGLYTGKLHALIRLL